MSEEFHTPEYWKQVVCDIESKIRRESRAPQIRNCDYSVTLPLALRNRVAKILPYEFDEYDRTVYIAEPVVEPAKKFTTDDEDDTDADKKTKKKKGVFNESTCSEIERLEEEFPKMSIKLDTPVKRKSKTEKKIFWGSKFICKPRKERVIWDSRIYHLENNVWVKTLDEQAEHLMDASAERFTEWLNSLGSNHDSDMSKERLKSLFSIEGDRRLLASIQTEPKEVKAIAKTVADKWNLPEMAIELTYEKYINEQLKHVPKKIIKVAFGRTIPYKDIPWTPSARDVPVTTVFPAELLSGKKLFKGIGHLRSTKALVKFYRHNPSLERPRHLVRTGIFQKKATAKTVQDVPLYERLKLVY